MSAPSADVVTAMGIGMAGLSTAMSLGGRFLTVKLVGLLMVMVKDIRRHIPFGLLCPLGLLGVSLLFVENAHAHYCRNPAVTMVKGEVKDELFIVKADHHDVNTEYTISVVDDDDDDEKDVLTVVPLYFEDINGTLNVMANEVGEAIITVEWYYPPTFVGGVCKVKVTVVEDISTANRQNAAVVSDPINAENGELFFKERKLLFSGGPMPLFFRPYYASQLRRSLILSRLGDNWRHNFDWALSYVDDILLIINAKGRVLRFIEEDAQPGTWSRINSTDIPHQVTQQTGPVVRFFLLDPRNGYVYTFGVLTGTTTFKLIKIEDGKSNFQTLTYNADGDLDVVTDNFGRSLTFTYDPAAEPAVRKLRSVTGGPGTVSLDYDVDNLISIRNERGDLTQYAYDQAHALSGLLTMRTLAGGSIPFRQTWNDAGQVATQADAAGNTSVLIYAGGTTTFTDPDGAPRVFVHGDNGTLVSVTDKEGNQTVIGADSEGRRSVSTDPYGGAFDTDYDTVSGKMSRSGSENGDSITYDYTTRVQAGGHEVRDLTQVNYPDGTAETFTYDASGNRLTHTDQAGNTTTRTYSTSDQVLSITVPTGGTTTFTYDAAGNRISQTNHAGFTTTFTYDAFNRLTGLTRPDGTTKEFAYDATNLLLSVTDERGKATTFGYDVNNNLTTVTDPAGNTTTYTYDDDELIVRITDRTGLTIDRTYDPQKRLASEAYSNGETFVYGYDPRGNRNLITDPEGNDWANEFDAVGRVTAGTDPLDQPGGHRLDPAGRIIAITNGENQETAFTYDAMGRVIAVRDPTGRVTDYSFDANGWVASITLPGGGSRALFERNGLSELTKITDAGDNEWLFTYDPQGRLIGSSDPLGRTTTRTYDNRNRADKITFPEGMGSFTVAYNGTGHATERAYSDDTTYTYGHDDLGRLSSFTGGTFGYDNESHMTSSNGVTSGYDPSTGRMASVTLATDKTVTFQYDGLGRVTGVSDWVGGATSFVYDAAGRMTSMTRPNGTTTTMSRDAVGRIVSLAEGSLSTITLTRDASGRVTGATRATPTVYTPQVGVRSFAYDAAGQVASFAYDSMGRLTQDDRRQYQWNLANGLTSYTEGPKAVSLTQNGVGHILSRVEGSSRRDYVWNYAYDFPAISVFRQDGKVERYYIHSPRGMLLHVVDATDNTRLFYHFDENGNTIFLSDEGGSVVESYAYSPYGEQVSTGIDVDNPFTFVGRFGVMREGTSGLYLMRQRYYDVQARRFISPEQTGPHIHPLAIVPYIYAAADPVNHFDPVGTDVGEVTLDVTRSVGQAAGTTAIELTQRADQAQDTAKWLEGWANQFMGRRDDLASKLIKKSARAGEKAAKLNRIAKPLKAGGRAGTALQIVDIGLEMNKFKNALNKALEDYNMQMHMAVDVYVERAATIWSIYRKKGRTVEWLEAKLHMIGLEMQWELFLTDWQYDLDFLTGFWTAWSNAIGSFVPGFTGFDLDNGQTIGFFYQ